MKIIKSIILLLAVGTFNTVNAATPWLHVDGKFLKDPAGNIVVLRGVALQDIGGQVTTPGIGLNGLLDKLVNVNDTEAGIPGWYARIVRFTISPVVSDFPGYYSKILKPAVDYATQKGLYVIIDNHFISNTDGNVNYTNAFWAYFAPLFKNYSNVLYEVYNEPINSSMTWTQFKPIMQSWVDNIRHYAPHNIILAGNPMWDQKVGDAAKNPLAGSDLVYVAHIYPGHFTDPAKKTQVEQAAALVPVFLSEWGFSMSVTDPLLQSTITAYGEPIITWAENLGLSWTAWCADDDWLPPMFTTSWTLRTGDKEMGGFTKQKLYNLRNDKQPKDIACVAPFLGPGQTICNAVPIAVSTGLKASGKVFRWYKDGTLLAAETGPALSMVPGKGVYRVEVDSNSCTMSDQVSVVDTLFKVNMTPSAVLKDSITLFAGDLASKYSYKWYKNSVLLPKDTLNRLRVFDKCGTNWSVNVSYPGCGSKTGSFTALCTRAPYSGTPIIIPGVLEVENYDIQNVPGLTYSDYDVGNNGGAYRNDDVDIEATKDVSGAFNIGWTMSNEWTEYSIAVKDTGISALSFRIASKTATGGQLSISLNGKDVTGVVNIPFTGDWQTWQTVVFNGVRFGAKDSLLRLNIVNGGFNINYIKVTKGYVQGLNEIAHENKINIYPNPFTSEINFNGTNLKSNTWRITNILGQEVLTGQGQKADVSSLSQGHYVLFVEGAAFKIVK